MTDEYIHWSYRDEKEEVQHCRIEATKAGRFIGYLMTRLAVYERNVEQLQRELKEKGGFE